MQIIQHCEIIPGVINNGNGQVYACEERCLKPFLKEFYKFDHIAYPKFYKMDEQCKLAFMATEVLLKNFNREGIQDEEIAVVLSNSESSLATDRNYWESTKSIASPALFVYTLPNIMIGEMAIRNRIKGENMFFISEDLDAPLLYQQTELVFQHTATKAIIAGWVNYIDEGSYHARLFLVSRCSEGMAAFNIENIENLNNK